MKKMLIICLMIILTNLVCFGLGQKEGENITLEIENAIGDVKNKKITMEECHLLGIAKIYVNPEDNIKYVIIRKDGSYYNPCTGLFLNEAICNTIFNEIAGSETEQTYNFISDKEIIYTTIGYYTAGSINLDPGNIVSLKGAYASGLQKIEAKYNGYDENIEIVRIYEDDSSGDNSYHIEKMDFSISPGFFKDERAFLAQGIPDDQLEGKTEGEKYKIRALSFMATFFDVPAEKTIFNDIAKSLVKNFPIPVFNFPTEYNEAEMKIRLKKALVSHFRFQFKESNSSYDDNTIRLPFLDLSKNTFDLIYKYNSSVDDRNVYIIAYLKYCFNETKDINGNIVKNAKPVLSNIIEEESKRKLVSYNYEKYTLLDADEGVALAKSVLRYLTWGVEYTPYSGDSTFDIGYSGNPVSGNLKDELTNWLGDDGSEENNNYLPYDEEPVFPFKITEQSNVYKKHDIKGDFNASKVTLVGHMNDADLKLSRIDLWTSENIAWNASNIQDTIPSTATIVDASRMNDGKVFLDSSQQQNYHIVRNSEDDEIEVGYIFTAPQQIGGMIIVRGKGVNDGGHNVNDFYLVENNGGTKFQIRYKTGGNYFDIIESNTADNYREYAYNYKEREYINRSNYPGYFLANGYNDRLDQNNEDVCYIYVVFPEPITECTEIKIIDKTGNSFLNIAELMVFENNPVQYLTDHLEPIPEGSNCSTVNVNSVYTDVNMKIDDNEDNSKQWKEGDGQQVDFDISNENQFLLLNGNPSRYLYAETDNSSEWVDIILQQSTPIKQIVVWEPDASVWTTEPSESEIFSSELIVLLDCSDELKNRIDFSDADEIAKMNDLYNNSGWFTTPFVKKVENNQGVEVNILYTGNPLPYAPKGIDCPRTFAYKMMEQQKAREWYKNNLPSTLANSTKDAILWRFLDETDKITTLAKDKWGVEDYFKGYISEIDLFWTKGEKLVVNPLDFNYKSYSLEYSDILDKKPFLPGLMINSKLGYVDSSNSLYCPDKIAGTDSLGMLMGGLAMSGIASGDMFLNAFNVDVRKILNEYYKMESTSLNVTLNYFDSPKTVNLKGLDSSGKPVYYAGNENSFLTNESILRFSRTDLERITVIVPDLKEVQPGDLIVKFNDEDEPHLGVVIKTMWDTVPSDIDEIMNKIYLVTARRGFQMAVLGSWGNPNGIFGGFTDNPKDYHVRRLLKLPAGQTIADNDWHGEDDWEMVELMLDELKCEVLLPNDTYSNTPNHWIPNTGEKLGNIQVKITGIYNKDTSDSTDKGNETGLPESLNEVKIISPEDPNYARVINTNEVARGTKNNINCNKGKGLVFYAQFGDGETASYTKIADIDIEDNETVDPKTLDMDTYYKVVYNGGYFDTAGKGVNGKLYVDDSDNLFFDNYTDSTSTNKFAVEAKNTARPGDDFQLRFALVNDPTVKGTSGEGEFIAVYDKKLLWRANLYLDECVNHTTGATIAGATDWNNRNPWYQDNSNLQNYNPWGISQTGGADVDGGQIDIQEWTRFDDSTGPGASLTALDNGEVYGSVAYSWAGADTPFHFNQDMLDQKDCINVFYRNVSGIWTNYYPNLPPVGAGNGETWPHTTSPTGNWDGYIFGSPTNNENHVWNPITISTPTRYPYTPNFTTYRDFIVGDHVDDETDIYTSYAAGLDCLGFIQRAANYPGNRYTTYELGYNRLSWLTTAWTWQGKATPEVWDINITTDEMHLIVPGDILYTPGHASIVLNIQYDGNEREVIPDNVTLIEAAYAGGSYMVVNHQTWGANYGGIAPGRSLGRLRTYE